MSAAKSKPTLKTHHTTNFWFLLLISLLGFPRAAASDTEEPPTPANDGPAVVHSAEFVLPILRAVRLWSSPEKLRLVLDFDPRGAGDVKLTFVQKERGLTFVLDFDAEVPENLTKPLAPNDAAVQSATVHRLDGGHGELLLSLQHKMPVRCFRLGNPLRLVVDCEKIYEEKKQSEPAPGLIYQTFRVGTRNGPVRVHALDVDLDRYDLKPALADANFRKKDTVASIAEREKAIAAINAGFFAGNGVPLGLLVIGEEMIASPLLHRTAFLIPKAGAPVLANPDLDGYLLLNERERIPVQGVNSPNEFSEGVILYTPRRGTELLMPVADPCVIVEKNVVKEIRVAPAPPLPVALLDRLRGVPTPTCVVGIPQQGYVIRLKGRAAKLSGKFNPGDRIELCVQLTGTVAQPVHAVGAGPRLVKDGKACNTARQERFQKDVAALRTSRTLLGMTVTGRCLLVCVDGRNKQESVGATLDEAAEWMIRLGATDALNLDGGSSVAMVINKKLVTLPTNGEEKKVSNALVVVPR